MTRLTAAGSAIVALTLVSAVTAWRLGWSELWVVAGAGAIALVLCRLACAVVPELVVHRRAGVTRMTAGASLRVTLDVRNPGRWRSQGRVALDRLGPDEVEVDLPRLGPGADGVVTFEIRARRRGHHSLGPLVLEQGDPLGLFSARRLLEPGRPVIVHPRHHPAGAVTRGRHRDLDSARAEVVEGTITFHGLRAYVPGDDLRRIHWRSSARTGTLVVRQDVDPSDPNAVVCVDAADVWSEDDLEEGLEVAASVLHASNRAGHSVRLLDALGRAYEGRDGLEALDALSTFAVVPRWELDRLTAARGTAASGLGVVVTGSVDRVDAAAAVAGALADEPVVVVVNGSEPVDVRTSSGARIVTAPSAAEAMSVWSWS